jgi:hypothetical protein
MDFLHYSGFCSLQYSGFCFCNFLYFYLTLNIPELKDQYDIMSVPCMIVNKKLVSFGKKGIDEILEIIEQGI